MACFNRKPQPTPSPSPDTLTSEQDNIYKHDYPRRTRTERTIDLEAESHMRICSLQNSQNSAQEAFFRVLSCLFLRFDVRPEVQPAHKGALSVDQSEKLDCPRRDGCDGEHWTPWRCGDGRHGSDVARVHGFCRSWFATGFGEWLWTRQCKARRVAEVSSCLQEERTSCRSTHNGPLRAFAARTPAGASRRPSGH